MQCLTGKYREANTTYNVLHLTREPNVSGRWTHSPLGLAYNAISNLTGI